ncbi:MAG: SDR family NAD(P)-dependent oxidoreductase, partial [Mesorhizobium sp.]
MQMKSEIAGEAAKQRHIQRGIDAKDKSKGNGKQQGAMQAGARKYPEPPFPEQHQPKPGHEWAIEPAPLYDAPFYIGSKKLDGKVAVITGGDSGIGRAVAVLYAREGADVAIVYLCEDKDAEETRRAVEAEGRRCMLVRADVTERRHCHKAVAEVVKAFGRIDVLVNNAAFQIHSSD